MKNSIEYRQLGSNLEGVYLANLYKIYIKDIKFWLVYEEKK